MLTQKQYELLVFIDQRLQQNGVGPSFKEMKEALGLLSKAGIHRLITAPEERGFLRRHHNRARALEVLRPPENVADGKRPTPAAMPRSDYPGRRAGSFQFAMQLADLFTDNNSDVVRVPLLGRIADGHPIESPHSSETHVCVPTALLPDGVRQLYGEPDDVKASDPPRYLQSGGGQRPASRTSATVLSCVYLICLTDLPNIMGSPCAFHSA